MRENRLRLQDMLEAIEKIELYQIHGRQRYNADELIQVWMLMHLQILGEAAANLSKTLRDANPQIPWKGIIRLRNIVVHAYFAVNLDRVWNTIVRDLPALKAWLQGELRR